MKIKQRLKNGWHISLDKINENEKTSEILESLSEIINDFGLTALIPTEHEVCGVIVSPKEDYFIEILDVDICVYNHTIVFTLND